MSTLSQFAPFAGGGLKSFQTGFVYAGTSGTGPSGEDSYFYDITVSSVSTTKSIPCVYGTMGGNTASAGYIYAGANNIGAIQPRLTSSTNLRLSQSGSGTYSMPQISARWQIAEAN